MQPDLYLRFAIVLLLVLGLIFLTAALIKRFAPGMPRTSRTQRRLSVVEVASLDPRRRLVLVRRDECEHLLLLGGTRDLVIESGIVPPRFRDEVETVVTQAPSLSQGSSDSDSVAPDQTPSFPSPASEPRL